MTSCWTSKLCFWSLKSPFLPYKSTYEKQSPFALRSGSSSSEFLTQILSAQGGPGEQLRHLPLPGAHWLLEGAAL